VKRDISLKPLFVILFMIQLLVFCVFIYHSIGLIIHLNHFKEKRRNILIDGFKISIDII